MPKAFNTLFNLKFHIYRYGALRITLKVYNIPPKPTEKRVLYLIKSIEAYINHGCKRFMMAHRIKQNINETKYTLRVYNSYRYLSHIVYLLYTANTTYVYTIDTIQLCTCKKRKISFKFAAILHLDRPCKFCRKN